MEGYDSGEYFILHIFRQNILHMAAKEMSLLVVVWREKKEEE